jgi:hypothetical protein
MLVPNARSDWSSERAAVSSTTSFPRHSSAGAC